MVVRSRRGLGLDVDIYNEKGKKVYGNKKVNWLLKTPTMPIKFWNDKNDKKFRKAYFQNIKISGTMEILYKEQKIMVL